MTQDIAMKLDALDVRLLNAVQADGAATADALARTVPISPSAVTRRLARLKSAGIVAGCCAVLSDRFLQPRLQALVQVQLDRHNAEYFQDLRKILLARPEVQFCAEVTGAFDLMVIIVARSMPHLNDMIDTLFVGSPAFRRLETSFIRRRWKASLVIPLDDGDCERDVN